MDCTPKPCPSFENTGKPWSLDVTGVVWGWEIYTIGHKGDKIGAANEKNQL